MSDLPKRLRIKAGMIDMSERIAYGSDSAVMREAADEIERLTSELRAARVYMESLRLQRELDQTRAERAANPFHGMYQDADGKIPVTSAGQLVGRVEYGNGSVGVQFNAANRPTAMPCGNALIEPGTWLEIDK